MSTISAGTTSGTALVNSGDTTGQLVLQTNGTTTAVTIGTNQVVTLAQPLPAGSGGTGATSLAAAGILTTGAAVTVAQGGTGSTSLTANNVLLGNGTSAVQAVAPGTNGNVLTSNGTTWTSAAPSTGGATAVGSIVFPNTFNFQYLAANPAAQVASPFFTAGQVPPYWNSGQAGQNTVRAVKWSSYYGGWFALFLVNLVNSNQYWLFFSADGTYWQPFCVGPNTAFATTALICQDQSFAIAVDDSNGRIFVGYRDNGVSFFDAGVYYTDAPAIQSTVSWTSLLVDTSGRSVNNASVICAMDYVANASTGTSGIVFVTGNNQTGVTNIYTMAAGTTTFTLRTSVAPSNPEIASFSNNSTFQRVAVAFGNSSTIAYTAANSLTSWSTATLPGNTGTNLGGVVALSSNRVAVLTQGGIRYSSNFSTWTTNASRTTSNTGSIAHNGTRWLAIADANFGPASNAGILSTTDTEPTNFVKSWSGLVNSNWYVSMRRA